MIGQTNYLPIKNKRDHFFYKKQRLLLEFRAKAEDHTPLSLI